MRREPCSSNYRFQAAQATYHGTFGASRNRYRETTQRWSIGDNFSGESILEAEMMHSWAGTRR